MSNTNIVFRAAALFCILATACSSPSETIALVAEDAPEALSFDEPLGTVPLDGASPSMTIAVATAERCGAGWSDVVAPLFDAIDVEPESIATDAVGDGCRSVAPTSTGEISVLLEPISSAAVEQLMAERSSATSFMGFEEREFLMTNTWASSSLLHPELDRLIESRWLILSDTDAIRIEVAVLGNAETMRDVLLGQLDALEGSAATYQIAGNAERLVTEEAWAANDDTQAVSQALSEILGRVASTVNLGPLATASGADAIAFEYAFPENFEALRSAHRPTDCLVEEGSARCELLAGQSTYAFDFVQRDGAWLLDDFTLAANADQ